MSVAELFKAARAAKGLSQQAVADRAGLSWSRDRNAAAPGFVDNIARFGRVLDPAPDDRQAQAVRDMFAMMGEHPRLDTAAIQTVGTKGWDGFAVAVIRP